ncbi:MAG: PEP-CTERM sorting domain-containing protein [Planctomycetota bacterium]
MKTTRMNILVCAALVGLLGLATAAQGDIIVQYGFGTDDGKAYAAPDPGSVADYVTASDVSGGSGSGVGDTDDEDPYDDGNTRSIYWQSTSDGSAEFTLDAADGYTVDYSHIAFKIDSEIATDDDEWYVSSDIFGEIAAGDITTDVDGNGNWTLADVDLSGESQLKGVDEVTFTIGFRDAATGTYSNVRIDKIQVEGTVVPEPATMALLGLGGLGMLIRRKRA